jgi:hypothetical protein
MDNLLDSYREKDSIVVGVTAMAIKLIFAFVAFFAVAFLTRFLVALLKEAALASRRERPRVLTVAGYRNSETRPRKLSRLKVLDQNEIRLIPMSQDPGLISDLL